MLLDEANARHRYIFWGASALAFRMVAGRRIREGEGREFRASRLACVFLVPASLKTLRSRSFLRYGKIYWPPDGGRSIKRALLGRRSLRYAHNTCILGSGQQWYSAKSA